MIEFNGYINGNAERFYMRNAIKKHICLLELSGAVFAPIVIYCASKLNYWDIVIGYGIFLLIIPIISCIPPSKKTKMRMIPKRIFTDEEYIICQGDNFEEYRLIEDITKVKDFGDFYQILFRFGKTSDNFICQKELLTKGTLEEFEALFEGKIERRQSK